MDGLYSSQSIIFAFSNKSILLLKFVLYVLILDFAFPYICTYIYKFEWEYRHNAYIDLDGKHIYIKMVYVLINLYETHIYRSRIFMYMCVYIELNRYRYFPIFCPNFLLLFFY